ncbi:MAG: 3'-5' exonuclease, partial [Bacteroidota bacterium]|nr:3'-5' exonuclease [Bacteroidota bacterium]
MQQGVSPYNIMALTFTNKAAKEMQERVIELVGVKAKALLMGTFHSIFSKILRIEGEKIGYSRDYTIYDDDDSKKLIADVVKNMHLDDKNYKRGRMLSHISMAKCALFSAEDYEKRLDFIAEDEKANIGEFYKVYNGYQKRLRQAMAMDFDDILFNMNVLLRDCPEVKEKYQKRFKYILVDEYQDTNYSQYLIIKKLAEYYKNICVVGDDAQSIYSFRGASISNILNFNKDYPQANVFKLEQNYRSSNNIIQAANSIISHNEKQIKKTIWTANSNGDYLHYFALETDRKEASFVADRIKQFIESGEKGGEIAILYRTNSQSRAFEDVLRLKNIPYLIYGSTSFYSRKEIKDAVAYIRLVVNNDDDEAFERIINYPARGIGATTIDKLKIAREERGLSLFKLCTQLQYNNCGLRGRAISVLSDFCNMIKSFSLRVEKDDAYKLGKEIIKRSGLRADLAMLKETEDKDRLENLDEFLASMQSFVEAEEDNLIDALTGEEINIENKNLSAFLQQISLMTSTDKEENAENNQVKLMTIHAAKGLEFNIVFVVGMEENLFPSTMSFAQRDDIEEERRLFYVALTRARKILYLTSANMRYKFGDVLFTETSRFVNEIDDKYIIYEEDKEQTSKPLLSFNEKREKPTFSLRNNVLTQKKDKPVFSFNNRVVSEKTVSLNLKPKSGTKEENSSWRLANMEEIKEGERVLHSKFGEGIVLFTENVQGDKRARVNFDNAGERTLILKFAKLKVRKD